MSGQNNSGSLGARGRQDAHMFLPQDLTLVVSNNVSEELTKLEKAGFITLLRDPKHFLYEKRADLPVDEYLAKNIGAVGLLQAIRIMRDGDRKVVMVGRQRVKSVALHNFRLHQTLGSAEADKASIRIPAMVFRADEAKAMTAIVSENEQRIQDTPIHRAEKMQKLIDLGLDETEVAAMFRMGVPQLKASLRLLDCAPEVRKAVDSGELPAYIASTDLSSLPRSEQVVALGQMREAGTLRGGAAQQAVADIKSGGRPAPREPGVPTKNRPSRKKLEAMVKTLKPKAEKNKLIAGVVLGLQKSLGQNPRGWAEIQALLEE